MSWNPIWNLGGHSSENCYGKDSCQYTGSREVPKHFRKSTIDRKTRDICWYLNHCITLHSKQGRTKGSFSIDIYENTASCFLFLFPFSISMLLERIGLTFKHLILSQTHYLPYHKDSHVINCCFTLPKHDNLHASKSN